ncbi:hypothetical protein INT45_008242 [Circinella minor]|uniref:J domain-containing protein n=1 Tax=Circinella minor TaxID=1195481 RepID=A0A8H7VHE8_9FUNG|nr:hypothetical protein INT45_008242 [Circinella minor]
MDYYKILELPHDASEQDIKKAYRRLALKYHPDKNSSPEAIENVIRAYEILSDESTRRVYDNKINDKNEEPVPTFHFNTMPRQQSQPQQKYTYSHDPFTGFQFRSPEDVFAQFFGGKDPFAMFNNDPFFYNNGATTPTSDPFAFPSMFGRTSKINQPLGGGGLFMSSSFGGGVGGGIRTSTSTTTRYVNGHRETVTITTIHNQNGTRVIEDYGDGQKRVLNNGVEIENTLNGHQRRSSSLNKNIKPTNSIQQDQERNGRWPESNSSSNNYTRHNIPILDENDNNSINNSRRRYQPLPPRPTDSNQQQDNNNRPAHDARVPGFQHSGLESRPNYDAPSNGFWSTLKSLLCCF